jgi:peptidoglycan/xylan/chitin deacetylase (PgdA/CDA1 family)
VGIPVLCYHRVGGPLELGVTRVSRSVFARQLQTIAQEGWRTLTFAQFADALTQPSSRIPRDAFLLTFDDGYGSLAESAYPVLADLGFTATTFLITDFIGRTNTWDMRYTWRGLSHLDWRAIEHWRGRGFDFASHGATHARLTWLADARVRDELGRSREVLQRRLGPEAGRAVAYPFGASDERIEDFACGVGYEMGFGGARASGSRFALSRVPVYLWDVGRVPFGLRRGPLGVLGRFAAQGAHRCAVGTSWMLKLRRDRGERDGAPARL